MDSRSQTTQRGEGRTRRDPTDPQRVEVPVLASLDAQDTSEPGGQRGGQEPRSPVTRATSRTGPRANADAEQPALELTLGPKPPTPPQPPARKDASSLEDQLAEIIVLLRETPSVAVPLRTERLEEALDRLPQILERARLAMAEAARETAHMALEAVTDHLQEQSSLIEAKLQERAQDAASVARLMEELLDNSVTLAGEIEKEHKAAYDKLLERHEALNQRAERQTQDMLTRADAQMKRLSSTAQDLIEEAKSSTSRLGWMPWAMSGAVAVASILMLTLLRPGWTMSADQRQALAVGTSVIYSYQTASAPERAAIRRCNRWPEPRQVQTAEPPPVR